MGGRGSGGGSYRQAPRPAARSAPPQRANNAPPPPAPATPKSNQSGIGAVLRTFGSNIVEGLGFGSGIAMAHRTVDAVLGPRTIKFETVDDASTEPPSPTSNGVSDVCSVHYKAFQDCMNGNVSDISRCQFYMDMLVECKRNSPSAMSS